MIYLALAIGSVIGALAYLFVLLHRFVKVVEAIDDARNAR